MITLTSDFGLRDPYVGIMKSRIVLRAPQLPIIDLTHGIAAFDAEAAGYWLYCCRGQFPPGTVHVAVVDPGVGSERSILVLEADGQLFVAPDNGLLGLIVQSCAGCRAYRVSEQALARLHIGAPSATFHGRDIMAPLGAELASARIEPSQVGPPHSPAPGRLQCGTRQLDGSLSGSVAVIDHFGNALTTIPAAALGALGRPEVLLDGRRLRLVRTYGEALAGECVALINSSSMLELAAGQASAARILNVQPGRPVHVLDGQHAAN